MALRRYIDRFVYLALAIALLATVFAVAQGTAFSDSARVVAALGTSPVSSAATFRHGWDQPVPLAPQSALFATLLLASVCRLASPSREPGQPIAVLSTPLRI